MLQKRYQYWSSKGIQWTPWFTISSSDAKQEEKYQLKPHLLNEYRNI